MRRPAESGRHVVVGVVTFDSAFPTRNSQFERRRASLYGFLDFATQRILADDGDVVSLNSDSLTATFGDDEGAAVPSMIAIQEYLAEHLGPDAPLAGIGIAAGIVSIHELPPLAHRLATGPAVRRAMDLSDHAAPGAILVEATVVSGLAMEFLTSRAGKAVRFVGHDYLSEVQELRSASDTGPIAYHELLWNAQGYSVPHLSNRQVGAPSTSTSLARGTAVSQGGTTLVIKHGEISYYVDGRDVIGTEPLSDGDVVYFSPDMSGPSPRARDVIPIGSRLTARVKKVFHDRRYAFVDVAGHDVFLHADQNKWPLNVGDYLRFVAAENERGLLVTDAELSMAREQ